MKSSTIHKLVKGNTSTPVTFINIYKELRYRSDADSTV